MVPRRQADGHVSIEALGKAAYSICFGLRGEHAGAPVQVCDGSGPHTCCGWLLVPAGQATAGEQEQDLSGVRDRYCHSRVRVVGPDAFFCSGCHSNSLQQRDAALCAELASAVAATAPGRLVAVVCPPAAGCLLPLLLLLLLLLLMFLLVPVLVLLLQHLA